ncbi:MAG: Ig-like domain-containing protein [Burkholderiales bacterium]
MVKRVFRIAAISVALLAFGPTLALAAGTQALFDLSAPETAPFPSDRFTVPDRSQNTGLRVNLPKPDCTTNPSDCADLDVINTLDGFNVQPRISIPFSGAIDVASVSSESVYLISLGDTLGRRHRRDGRGDVIGINQVLFDPATSTLHVESDELLEQHTRYVLIVTNGVRDAAGDPVEAGTFARFRHDVNFGQTGEPALKAYREALLEALEQAAQRAGQRSMVVAASVFSTQSVSSDLEKIRDQIKASHPAAANFLIGSAGERAVFALGSITGINFNPQISTVPAFGSFAVPVSALQVVPGAVSAIAFGKYASPDYETQAKFIPAVGTRAGTPEVQGTNDLYFNLFLPSGSQPANGWPVAIFGHGFGDNKNNSPLVVASVMASQGVATIAINVVGHGFGSLGTLTVNRNAGGPVVIPAGGRGIDQNGNGSIDSTEGSSAAPPRGIIASRDGLRQTVTDLMQLVRVIQAGVDVDGDNAADLDTSRIYYFGQSFGGIYGTKLLAVEPDIRAGVPNVAGGSIIEIVRLGGFRPLLFVALASRMPALLNGGPNFGFDENIPLRNLPPVVNTVAGAMPIQKVIDNTEWVSQSGNPVAYAPYIRKSPLDGRRDNPVIFQVAKGDKTVPNPTSTAILRAGDLADRTTYFRNDLVVALDPLAPTNPHTFLTRVGTPSVAAYAVAAQQQIAVFFAADGSLTIDPDGAGPIFETPIVPPLPEELNFIP